MATRRRPSLKARLLLALTPIVVIGAVTEIVCRRLEKTPWYEQLEGEQVANQQFDYYLNALHCRDREYQCPPPPGHERILFLGDSFTFGTGVRVRTDLFTEIVEARLEKDKPDPSRRHYEILNAGIPGLLTDEWLEGLKGPLKPFRPDLVVAVFFVRDGTSLAFQKDLFNPVRDRMNTWRRESRLARWSSAWRTIRGRFLVQEISADYLRAFDEQYFGDETQTQQWRAAQQHLVEMRDLSVERGARFLLVVFPLLFQLDQDYPLRGVCEEIERFGRDQDIPTFSLLPAFEGREASELWVSEFDQHPNEAGHRIVADALEPWLRSFLKPGDE